jgi:hypothetical protein
MKNLETTFVVRGISITDSLNEDVGRVSLIELTTKACFLDVADNFVFSLSSSDHLRACCLDTVTSNLACCTNLNLFGIGEFSTFAVLVLIL